MPNQISVDSIILAAGLSRRMGPSNKLLLSVDGQPLVRKLVKLYQSVSSSVTVVLGHEADRVAQELVGLEVTTVINPEYQKGRQSSARYGLDHLDIKGDAVLIGLADQHRLTSEDLEAFVVAYQENLGERILIPEVDGQRGNPILFPAKLARQIQEGDKALGLRQFIDQNPDKISWHKTSCTHFIEDLDTPDDAAQFGIKINS